MISLKTRLECPHSFATDDSPHLYCDFDGRCDGKLYACCLDNDMGRAISMVLEYTESEVKT